MEIAKGDLKIALEVFKLEVFKNEIIRWTLTSRLAIAGLRLAALKIVQPLTRAYEATTGNIF